MYTALCKGKGEVVPVHPMTARGEVRSIDPLILNLGSKWR